VSGLSNTITADGIVIKAEAMSDDDSDGLMDDYDQDKADTSTTASIGTEVKDTDSDGIANFLDLDSDNDTISDLNEGQSTAKFINLVMAYLGVMVV